MKFKKYIVFMVGFSLFSSSMNGHFLEHGSRPRKILSIIGYTGFAAGSIYHFLLAMEDIKDFIDNSGDVDNSSDYLVLVGVDIAFGLFDAFLAYRGLKKNLVNGY